jgi:hypothetical protein
VIFCLFVPFLLGSIQPSASRASLAQTQQSACTWQLTGDSEKLTTSQSASGATASREGNWIKTQYTHAANAGCSPPTLSTIHTWTQPPTRLTPGQTVNFNVSASWELAGPPSCTSLSTGLRTYIMAGATTITAQKSKVIVSKEPNGAVANSGSWVVPAGSREGATMTITAYADAAVAGGTVTYQYRYSCQPPPATPTRTITKAVGATLTPTVTQTVQPFVCPCPPEQGGDSGARFSDFSGEVTVAHCTDLKDLHPAEFDMVLERGMYIQTESESSAILSFADMTTFAMKPFTTVILECRPPKQTALQLIAGKVWVNVKKMIKDGTMEVTLTQAVAGTKGTVFVVEENGQISTVKVLEGTVSYTSRATGQSVLVTTGQMVSASIKGLSPVAPFDIAQELTQWPEALINETSRETPAAAQPRQGGLPLPTWAPWALAACIGGLFLLAFAGLGVLLLLRKR